MNNLNIINDYFEHIGYKIAKEYIQKNETLCENFFYEFAQSNAAAIVYTPPEIIDNTAKNFVRILLKEFEDETRVAAYIAELLQDGMNRRSDEIKNNENK